MHERCSLKCSIFFWCNKTFSPQIVNFSNVYHLLELWEGEQFEQEEMNGTTETTSGGEKRKLAQVKTIKYFFQIL